MPRSEVELGAEQRVEEPDSPGSLPEEAGRRAEALFQAGEMESAAREFLALPAEMVTAAVVDRMGAAASRLGRHEIAAIAAMAADNTADPRFGPVFAQRAFSLALSGKPEEAREFAIRARNTGAKGRVGRIAAAVLDGDLSSVMLDFPVIGAVLPVSGSPSNREYARRFMEGAEVAAQLARRAGVPVEWVVEDNRGTVSGTARGVSALVARGAVAILGPLVDENVSAAAQVKPREVALFSPTARRVPVEQGGVYSLGATDPGAARTLAAVVSDLGYGNAVVVHPETPGETLEAAAFEEAFQALGGNVRRRIPYAPGTTTFEGPLVSTGSLLPELLVVAAPAADLELLAPQIAFFGLDTLGIQIAGTAAWTAPSTIRSVARRHTDRVIAVSPVPTGSAEDRSAEFVEAYENHFLRTLDSAVPAAGFDLFRMALTAYGEGLRTAEELVDVLEGFRRFEGVTGRYSVAGSRLVREFFPVRIFEGTLLPVDAELPELSPSIRSGGRFPPGVS